MFTRKMMFILLAAGLVLAFAAGAMADSYTVDLSAVGNAISPNIRGQATRSMPMDTGFGYPIVEDAALSVVDGSFLRGVGGGLIDDMYDWRDPQGQQKNWQAGAVKTWPVIQYLRWARDHQATPLVTANTRGVGYVWGGHTGFEYQQTDVAMLAQLAADYVRYTNFIIHNYRMGNTIPAGRDKNIIDYIRWSHALGSWSPLLETGEATTPMVKYWEIGNEPEVPPANSSTGVPQMTLTPAEYLARYKTISSAMLAEDGSIKVGPCFAGYYYQYLPVMAADPACRIDFVSFHPYGGMQSSYPVAANLENALRTLYNEQESTVANIRTILTTYGRSSSTPVIASEWNPGGPNILNATEVKTMAQGLGCAETLFAFAKLDVFGACYWLYPDDTNPAIMPSMRLFEAAKDYLGEKLIGTYTDNANFRLYTTYSAKDRRYVLWGLNFSDTADKAMTLSLANRGFTNAKVAVKKLVDLNGGDLSLLTKSTDAGVSLGWSTQEISNPDLSALNVTFEDATFTLVIVEPLNCARMWETGQGRAADLNQDCEMDFEDLMVMMSYWLSCSDPAQADCN